jgi:hypothetical protein
LPHFFVYSYRKTKYLLEKEAKIMLKRMLTILIACLLGALLLTACNATPTNTVPASTATPNTNPPPTAPNNQNSPTPSRPTAAPPTPASVDANLGSPFTLTKGEKKTILNERLTVQYIAVKDSRCPANVVCGWSGIVDVDLVLTTQGSQVTNFSLSLYGSSGVGLEPTTTARPTPRPDDKNTKTVDGYSIRLIAVEPYPGLETSNPPVYTLTMLIVRA